MTSFLAIASPTGGIGKTTTTIQLAKAFAYLQHSVLVVDLHLSKPNVGILLKLSTQKHIHSALDENHDIVQAIHTHESIKVIPGSDEIEHLEKEFSTYQIEKVLQQLVNHVDIVLIDTPSGLGQETKRVLQACEHILILSATSDTAIIDTNRMIEWLTHRHINIIGTVIQKEKKPHKRIQEQIKNKIIGNIPHFKNPQYLHPEYITLAANIIGKKYSNTEPDNIISYVLQRIGLWKR